MSSVLNYVDVVPERFRVQPSGMFQYMCNTIVIIMFYCKLVPLNTGTVIVIVIVIFESFNP